MKTSTDLLSDNSPSLNLLPGLLEQHSVINLIIDPKTGQIIDANKAAEQFYGWPLTVLKQMNIKNINTLPPEAVQDAMNNGMLSGKNKFEFRHRRADGSIRDVEVFSNKIGSAGKNIL
jgi:PAS domain S-box-containing protein